MRRLGLKSELQDLPTSVTIDGSPYILTRINNNYELYSAICPHKQGTVHPEEDDRWVCHNHGWIFDGEGICSNVRNESLESYPVYLKDGVLYTEINDAKETAVDIHVSKSQNLPRVSLVSHATLLFEYNGFRMLTDPWILGEAFQGSWTQYPPSPLEPNDIGEVDAIWITHEHSDHLHPETLAFFDKSTPVYIPEFRCQRLRRRMVELGFSNIHVMPNQQAVELNPSVHAICFESQSVWNDSIQYLNFGGFEILNVNDAGINRDVADIVGPVDVVASAFSQGASGYPMTWNDIPEEEKKSIIRTSNEGQLAKFEDLVTTFKPDFVLPIASFQALWHPEHKEYLELQEKNRPADIIAHLDNYDVEVIDLYPGESWNQRNITRRDDRDKWFSDGHREEYLRRYTNDIPIPDPFEHTLTHSQLRKYFEELSDSTYAKQAGDLAVSFTADGGEESPNIHAVIRFNDGDITYNPRDKSVPLDDLNASYNIRMKNPAGHVQTVIEEDLSWDEITTGYWGTRSRDPDQYNMEFWKLLCVPWEARRDNGTTESAVTDIRERSKTANRSVANLVEEHPETVPNILRRHGLYCAGCSSSVGETIVEGCLIHGFSASHTKAVIDELEQAIQSET